MAFTHEFTVAAPREKVVSFHRKRQSLAAITPPPMIVRIQTARRFSHPATNSVLRCGSGLFPSAGMP